MLLPDLTTTVPSSGAVRQPCFSRRLSCWTSTLTSARLSPRAHKKEPYALVSLSGAVFRRRLSRQFRSALHQRDFRPPVSQSVCVAARTGSVVANRERSVGQLQFHRRHHAVPRRSL